MAHNESRPFWVDELQRKHEGYSYGETDTRSMTVEHEGRSLRLLVPEYRAPIAVKVASAAGDFLFLLGAQLDQEDEDGEIIEGGDGVVAVARRIPDRDDTYWVFIWHELYDLTLPNAGIEV